VEPRRRLATLAATVMLSIAVLVVGTRPRVPHLLRTVPDWATHGTTYAVLAAFASESVTALGVAPAAPWGVAYAVAHGCLLELLQMLVPTRTAELRDVAADACGALLGVGALALRKRR
jgi:VanZ family protein